SCGARRQSRSCMVPGGAEGATFAATPVKRQACARGSGVLSTGNTSYIAVPGPRGGVVTQRTANPRTPVQFRAWPPTFAPSALRLADRLIPAKVARRGSRERRAAESEAAL